MSSNRQHHGIGQFLRSYTGGLDLRRTHRILGRDASLAYQILTREHANRPEPERAFAKLWHRTKFLFLGLSDKLVPARRVVFGLCILAALLSLQYCEVDIADTSVIVSGGSPLLWLAVGGLVLLLVLELADRVVVRDELEVARELQRALLPESPPEVEGYSFAFSSATANTIGGDYYDFLKTPDGRIAVVMGDASGHGIAAGILMAISNAILKLAIDLDPTPSAVATLMNRVLFQTGGSRDFMTLFLGILDPTQGQLDYVSVGHPYPLLRRASGNILELGSGSLPLGIRQTIDPAPGVVTLEPGDLVVMVTDGIPEAVNTQGRTFGFDRLRTLVSPGGDPHEVHRRIVSALRQFTAGATPHDDWSLLILRREG
jgi:sigma-B regulation protein RsbU (phosphoserine phosphatase)